MGKATLAQKLLCYPMPGPVTKQFDTLLGILRAVDEIREARKDLVRWMCREFSLKDSYSRKVYAALLKGMGLIERHGGVYGLTPVGKEILRLRSDDRVYELFSDTFFGIDLLVRALLEAQAAPWEDIYAAWGSAVRSARREPRTWSSQHLRSQLRFRLDWLRSLQRVDFVAGRYFLLRKGRSNARQLPFYSSSRGRSADQLSHNDIEDKLTMIGAFFQFEVKKRASVNAILPPVSHLREDRQLDSLWVRFVHFGGKIQYPFEVQLAGSIADAIERLEMVANFVQKAVVVTNETQQRQMLDRLRVKRSVLLDKIVFLSPEEIDKILDATIVMKSFTEALFRG